jgi:hypothetical protein
MGMKQITPEIRYFEVYFSSFRTQVHQLIAWGFSDARQRICSNNELEPSISGFIAEAIEDRLFRGYPTWCQHYFVKDDPPQRTPGRSGRSRLRSDITIQANFPGRPEYVFEAKRLKRRGWGVDKYIGDEGIGQFLNGAYAARCGEAAMLGYIQSDSPGFWQIALKKAIDDKASLLFLKYSQHDEKIIDDFPLEWVSKHDRPAVGQSIDIYHILLDCKI